MMRLVSPVADLGFKKAHIFISNWEVDNRCLQPFTISTVENLHYGEIVPLPVNDP